MDLHAVAEEWDIVKERERKAAQAASAQQRADQQVADADVKDDDDEDEEVEDDLVEALSLLQEVSGVLMVLLAKNHIKNAPILGRVRGISWDIEQFLQQFEEDVPDPVSMSNK